jgi:hypothetical protein
MDIMSLFPIILIVAVSGLCFFIFTRFLINVGSDEIATTKMHFFVNELALGRVFALDNGTIEATDGASLSTGGILYAKSSSMV